MFVKLFFVLCFNCLFIIYYYCLPLANIPVLDEDKQTPGVIVKINARRTPIINPCRGVILEFFVY